MAGVFLEIEVVTMQMACDVLKLMFVCMEMVLVSDEMACKSFDLWDYCLDWSLLRLNNVFIYRGF